MPVAEFTIEGGEGNEGVTITHPIFQRVISVPNFLFKPNWSFVKRTDELNKHLLGIIRSYVQYHMEQLIPIPDFSAKGKFSSKANAFLVDFNWYNDLLDPLWRQLGDGEAPKYDFTNIDINGFIRNLVDKGEIKVTIDIYEKVYRPLRAIEVMPSYIDAGMLVVRQGSSLDIVNREDLNAVIQATRLLKDGLCPQTK